MANATPVHSKAADNTPPNATPAKPKKGIEKVEHHPVVKPGQTYQLPDGTIVRDN